MEINQKERRGITPGVRHVILREQYDRPIIQYFNNNNNKTRNLIAKVSKNEEAYKKIYLPTITRKLSLKRWTIKKSLVGHLVFTGSEQSGGNRR